MKTFHFYKQYDKMDCGPTCLRMIARHYGKTYTLQTLREYCNISREGVSLFGVSHAAEKIGFRSIAARVSWEVLKAEVQLPCIAHWNKEHFIVIYKIKGDNIYVADPEHGLSKFKKDEFLKGWINANNSNENEAQGIVLILEPSPTFSELEDEKSEVKKGFGFLFSYLLLYKKLLIQLGLAMILGSLLQLIFPFLTQSIVDFGINHKDINFIYLILIAQLVLFFSRTTVDFIRSWILLYIGSRISINLISDFLVKLMKLPIAYFDTKLTGDILQRINDHHRIEQFLTASTLNVLFSLANLVTFSFVLAFYNPTILGVFIFGSVTYAIWVIFFLKKRKDLNYKQFNNSRDNQDNLIQLIHGMQEIKLHNCERQKRWEWEKLRAKSYKITIQNLKLDQRQQAGAVFINELKNIIITFLAAKAVIGGHMTLGMMLSVQYIIGQLNSPIEQMISFIQVTQDAKLSFERLSEIHNKKDEDIDELNKIHELPDDKSIKIDNLSFRYEGVGQEDVLKDINLTIPEGKITAIVGTSGSGKTTLLKLLLKFYMPHKGNIKIGTHDFNNFGNKLWRSKCGAVMQDGFIFSDSIARNIAVGEERIDKQKLDHSVKIANIKEFIDELPLGYNTKIGSDGNGLSQGQKQRILIARAVYKDPQYIFFDEATNALDSKNEKVIMENLNEFFKGRTVVVVAHRLSTVRNSDKIIVLEKGKLVEAGTHEDLVSLNGSYFSLVKNQLELGS